MSNLIAKDLDIDACCEEWQWEDAQRLGETIVDKAIQAGKHFAFIAAQNVNWRQASGYKVIKLDDVRDRLWQEISGINGDWSMRSVVPIRAGKQFGVMVYSHDTPTGGLRSVRPLSGEQLYHMFLKQLGMLRHEIVEEFDGIVYNTSYEKPTNAQIFEAIEYADVELVETMFASARDDE